MDDFYLNINPKIKKLPRFVHFGSSPASSAITAGNISSSPVVLVIFVGFLC